jgi:hypothetical protein
MLVEASIEFHQSTVRAEFHTLRDMVAVFLYPCARKFAYGKGHVVNSSTDGIDNHQLATPGTAAPTRDSIVSSEFHGGFSAAANHCSEQTLIFVQDGLCGLSTVDVLHWIVPELWAELLSLRRDAQSEEAQVKNRNNDHPHTASSSTPPLPEQRPANKLARTGVGVEIVTVISTGMWQKRDKRKKNSLPCCDG